MRSAAAGDVAGIRAVSAAAGQPPVDSGADAEYVALVLRTGTTLVAVADEDRVVGWGAARSHAVGTMISDLFVHPDYQGFGIGRSILAELCQGVRGTAFFTFSSRHPSALPIYARAGLQPGWPLLYLEGPNSGRRPDLTVETADVAAATAAEAQLSGFERSVDYAFWLRQPSSRALAVRDGARLAAIGVVRAGAVLHLCCPREQDADAALAAVFAASGVDPVSACLPGGHPAVVDLLGSGFRVADYDISMATVGLALPVSWSYSPGLG